MRRSPYLPSLYGKSLLRDGLFFFIIISFCYSGKFKLEANLQPQHQWMGIHDMLGHSWCLMVCSFEYEL